MFFISTVSPRINGCFSMTRPVMGIYGELDKQADYILMLIFDCNDKNIVQNID